MELQAKIVVSEITFKTEGWDSLMIEYRFDVEGVEANTFRKQTMSLKVNEEMKKHIEPLKALVADMIATDIRENKETIF